MLDNIVEIDIDLIKQNIQEADVLTFFFPLLGESLVVDMRLGDKCGPIVYLAPIAESYADRYLSVREHRPDLSNPESFSTIPWRNRVSSLESFGLWDVLMSRLASLNGSENAQLMDVANNNLRKLKSIESTEVLRAITGDTYKTLWAK
ncbi:MAG: hypothetical protein ACJ0KD_03435 [Dehalococcoidia bacterium]